LKPNAFFCPMKPIHNVLLTIFWIQRVFNAPKHAPRICSFLQKHVSKLVRNIFFNSPCYPFSHVSYYHIGPPDSYITEDRNCVTSCPSSHPYIDIVQDYKICRSSCPSWKPFKNGLLCVAQCNPYQCKQTVF